MSLRVPVNMNRVGDFAERDLAFFFFFDHRLLGMVGGLVLTRRNAQWLDLVKGYAIFLGAFLGGRIGAVLEAELPLAVGSVNLSQRRQGEVVEL